jgi:eukaryotic-like serine/threonine-protein kinase
VPAVFEPLRDDDPFEAGGYRLYARIGAGGMGQVFLSFLPGGRPVALKVVRRELADDPEFQARFAVEASAAQRVNGVHIAPLLDAGPDAQPPWLATAYVPGPTLGEVIRRFGPLAPASVRALVGEVAAALGEVHAAGVVHRDLKPANVVLAADHPRLIDFGVARAADATTATVMGLRVGSPQYLAPEQVAGQAATPATDVFALGALAYYAATGRPAFGEGPEVGVVHRVLSVEPPLDGCPPELLDLVRACLAKDPAARPTTDQVVEACRSGGTAPQAQQWLPAEVLNDIQVRGEAVAAAARQGPPRLPSRSGARRRTLALALAAVLLGGAAGVVITARTLDDPADAVSKGGTSPATSSAATAVASPSAMSPSAALSPSVEGSAPGAAPDEVQWHGNVRFDTDGIDLDKVPPTVRMNWPSLDADLSRAGANADGPLNAGDAFPQPNLALWTGPGTPTRQQCAEQVDTTGNGRVHIPKGRIGCLRTSKDRVAMFTVTAYPDDSFSVTAQVTVWAATDS